jgi:predicted membrane channel-forming protein YqfA (hemolysin III family)
MARNIVLFAALFFVGLTAGAAFAVLLDSSPSGLSPGFYAAKMQHAIQVFMIPLNTVAILGVLFTIAATILARREGLRFYLLIAALICIIMAFMITAFGSVPIINQITKWNINSPPSDWLPVGNRWWSFQAVRTTLQMVALGIMILSTFVRRNVSN